jgi:transcriptional regulator with XRE-family HTH domain
MSNKNSLGSLVKRTRTQEGITQQELADRLGCSVAFVRKMEYDEAVPGAEPMIQRLAYFLECNTDTVYALSGKIPPDVRIWIEKHLDQVTPVIREMMH